MSALLIQKTFKTAAITSLIGFSAVPAFAQSNSTAATLYQHCNYGGYAVALPAGSHNYGALIRRGAKNDDVSSIKVTPGHKIKIFRDANFKGPSKTFDKDVPCLVSHRMNDFLSSVKVSEKTQSSNPVAEGATHNYLTGVAHGNGKHIFVSHNDVNGSNVGLAIHDRGYFEQAGKNSKTWKEHDADGKVIFTFQETNRDEWSVYMKDNSRGMSLQIDIHRKWVRYGYDGPLKDLYQIKHAAHFHHKDRR